MSFAALGLLILLGIALTSLSCAAYFRHTVWTVLSALLVYAVVCTAILAYGHKVMLEKRANNVLEALERSDNTGGRHVELSDVHIDAVPSASAYSVNSQSPRQQYRRSPYPHPGPLNSNPLHGPGYGSASNISVRNLSDPQDSMPAFPFQTSSTATTVASDNPAAIQMPARARATTDTGLTAQQQAAKRTRANTLMQIRKATARRMTVAGHATLPRQDTIEQDN